jgi:hypothetical protein
VIFGRGRRGRFADLIGRQLELFATEHADLVEETEELLRRYREADRDDAEEAYGDYGLAVEAATEALADIRDRFGRTLDESVAEWYEDEFNRAAAKRYPAFGVDLPNT